MVFVRFRFIFLLPIVLVAFTAYVARLAAYVTSFTTRFLTVSSDMTSLVTVVAALSRETAGIITLGAATSDVPGLVTVVTTQLGNLLTQNFFPKTQRFLTSHIFTNVNSKKGARKPFSVLILSSYLFTLEK